MIDTENHGFHGLWIPAGLWMDESLSLLEKAIIADVLSFEKYYKSNARMAKFFGVTERRIQQTVKEMEEKNLIVRVAAATETGRTLGRIIKLSWAYHQKLYPRPFPEESESRGEENFVGRAKKISPRGEENFAPYIKNTDKNKERDITTSTSSSSHSSTKGEAAKKEEEEEKEYFQIPTREEVAEYVTRNDYQMDAFEFWSFYEKRGWKTSTGRIRDWRKCCDKWERSLKVLNKLESFAREYECVWDTFESGFDFEGALKNESGRSYPTADEWSDV